MITKLLVEMSNLGCLVSPNGLKMEQTTKKDIKDKIDIILEKPK